MRRIVAALVAVFLATSLGSVAHAEEQFNDSDIRVIKNKFFQKSKRVELAVTMSGVINQAFVSTYLGGLNLGFHFTESIGIFAEGQYGFTSPKTNCDVLGKKFRIEPVVVPMKMWAGGGLEYTPIYGKYQLSNGDVIYFDTFFTAGGGIATLVEKNDNCAAAQEGDKKINAELSATQFNVGLGQKFFLNKDIALTWQLKLMVAQPPKNSELIKDGSNQTFVNILLGAAYFL